MVDDPVPLFLVDHLATTFAEDACSTRVDHEQSRVAEVAIVRPAARARLAVAHACELPQPRAGVIIAPNERQHRLRGELGRREVSDVLVDPVRHDRARDAGVPPRLVAHLGDPTPGDIPVVVDVVIVEDHRVRDGGEQPANVGIRPRLAVETRVFLEVGHLLPGRLTGVAPRFDELERRGRDLVRVDLVAEQEDGIRPFRLAALEHLRICPERVDARSGELLGPRCS
jgi:hypothetical protein